MRDEDHGAHTIQYMQQQCNHLGTLCNNVDLKASVFLSLLAAMLLAYAYSPVANLITLVGAAAFTLAVPMRIGVRMLGNRTVAFGAKIALTGEELLPMSPDDRKKLYIDMVNSLREATFHNDDLLRQKQYQNWSLMVISLSVFGFVMAMTAAGAFIEFPAWPTSPFRWA